MVNYASKCFDALEALEIKDFLKWQIICQERWQEYIENGN